MNLVRKNLYIGSLEDANDVESMRKFKVTRVISIGCPSPENDQLSECVTYLNILDTPEQSILGILQKTDEFIKVSISEDSAVLVSHSEIDERDIYSP